MEGLNRVTPLVEAPPAEPALLDRLDEIIAGLDALAKLPGHWGSSLLADEVREFRDDVAAIQAVSVDDPFEEWLIERWLRQVRSEEWRQSAEAEYLRAEWERSR